MTLTLASVRDNAISQLDNIHSSNNNGSVLRVNGIMLTARLRHARIGDPVTLKLPSGEERLGEITGVDGDEASIASYSDLRGVCNLTRVIPSRQQLGISVGPHMLGQILDVFGQAHGVRAVKESIVVPVVNAPPPALERQLISTRFETGIKVLDTMLSAGAGQRFGIFGGAGLGKSTLISMLLNNSNCDVAVIGLVGERGREVMELWQEGIRPEVRDRSVMIASTSDRPPIERRLAAMSATAVAEGFRDMGLNVLLIVDSVTRLARAQRDIGLASGEPPARRGFPPSTTGMLAELLERAGPGKTGSITAFYSVLVEGDIDEDPIAEELKAILDGHIVLSRDQASAGQFPAIDVLASRSRLHEKLSSEELRDASTHIRRLIAKYQDVELLLQIGDYVHGSDPIADEAIEKIDAISKFFEQKQHDFINSDEAIQDLQNLAYGNPN